MEAGGVGMYAMEGMGGIHVNEATMSDIQGIHGIDDDGNDACDEDLDDEEEEDGGVDDSDDDVTEEEEDEDEYTSD